VTRALTLIAAAAVAYGLASCSGSTASSEPIVRSSYRGVASPAPSHEFGTPFAVRHARSLELTVYGSGSCPAVPVALKVHDATVEITMTDHGGGVCTADMAATTWVIDLPASVPRGSAVTVQLRGLSGPPVTLVVPDLANVPSRPGS
jgi:hypothetical protein